MSPSNDMVFTKKKKKNVSVRRRVKTLILLWIFPSTLHRCVATVSLTRVATVSLTLTIHVARDFR